MKIIFNDVADEHLDQALACVKQFKEKLPDDHKDCAFKSDNYICWVKRTKAGNICVNLWPSEDKENG